MKNWTLEEELAYANKCGSWEKICRRSHTSHEVMDTRHTTEVNITKSSSCYTGIASPKPSKPSKIKDNLQALKRRIKLWDEGYIEGLFYKCMTIQ